MSLPIVKYTPGAISRIGQGAASNGVKITKNQAINQIVHYVINKVTPNLHPVLKQQAVKFLSGAVNDLLHAGQDITAKKLLAHAQRALPGYLKSVSKLLPDTPKMTVSRPTRDSQTVARGSSSMHGGVAIGGTTTAAPVALSHNVRRTSKPRMRNRGDAVVISHSELIGSLLSGAPTSNVTAYRSVGFRANPGLANIFPWLSSVAVNYEKYRFRKLSIRIIPLVSTAYNGRIGIGFDFDSSDVAPANRQEFYSLSTHAESMPWQACGVVVPCDSAFRFTGTHVAADNKLVDLGQVIVMSDSISNGLTLASAIPLYDLIVDYEVELIEPQQALFATQSFNGTANFISGVPLGTGTDLTIISGPSVVTSTSVTTFTLTFNLSPGTYAFAFRYNWSSATSGCTISNVGTGSGQKSNLFSGASFAAGVGVCTGTSDFAMVITVSTNNFTSNLIASNLLVTRVPMAVYNGYISA